MTHPTFPEYPQPLKKRVDAIEDEEIAKALFASKGLQYLAAERLNCSPSLLTRRIQESPYLAAVRDDARERRIDNAERVLDEIIESKDTVATIFLLKTLGKERGYHQEERKPATANEIAEAVNRIKNTSKELIDDKNSSG